MVMLQRKTLNQPQVLRESVMLIGSKTELVTIGEDTYSDNISLRKFIISHNVYPNIEVVSMSG